MTKRKSKKRVKPKAAKWELLTLRCVVKDDDQRVIAAQELLSAASRDGLDTDWWDAPDALEDFDE